MWYKITTSNKEEISVKEELYDKIMGSEDQVVTFLLPDGTKKTLNKSFIISGGYDYEKNEKERLEKERIDNAILIQKRSREASEKK